MAEGEETQTRTRLEFNHQTPLPKPKQDDLYLGILTKKQLIMIFVAVGLVILLIIIIVPAVVLSNKSEGQVTSPSFSTGGSMLDYLMQLGEIDKADGLLATWYHRANSKEEMNKALSSNAMILEADVNLWGYATPSQKPIPIMVHTPDYYSDNTLDQWLDAVLSSRKAIKLDFKSLDAVGLSLDLLRQKNISRGINRPVWLNADILRGPNVPAFVPTINWASFFKLIQEKFPQATVSPGWKVLYAPTLRGIYTEAMVREMLNVVQGIPQEVTFPIHTLLVQRSWPNLLKLLQSTRFTMTLWQGKINPNVSDLVFVRDNTNPTKIYYDIEESTMAEFKEILSKPKRLRRFYPGGDLLDFLHPTHHSDTNVPSTVTQQHSSLSVRWVSVTDQRSLLAQLRDGAGGMLVIKVASDSVTPGLPVVKGSGNHFKLEDLLQLLAENAHARWGIYLQVDTQQLLEASLRLLDSAYYKDQLFRPVWISLETLQSSSNTEVFVSTVKKLFPCVTLVVREQNWPPQIPAAVADLYQRVALHLNAAGLPKGEDVLHSLKEMMDRYDFIVEGGTDALTVLKGLESERTRRETSNTNLYVMSDHN